MIHPHESASVLLDDIDLDVAPVYVAVMKMCSRCDLACDYCYMYKSADQSWRNQPRIMDERTVEQAAFRLGEQALTYDLDVIEVMEHGGEALLVPPERRDWNARTITSIIDDMTKGKTIVRFGLQTNLTRITEEQLEVCDRWGYSVGASIDGNRVANDRHRLNHRGESGHDKIMDGWQLLSSPKYRHLISGIAAVIDLNNDPLEDVYFPLKALLDEIEDPEKQRTLELYLPHGNWDSPPDFGPGGQKSAPYAAWLDPIMRQWIANNGKPGIRIFDSILNLWRGNETLVESLGGEVLAELVIETDGSIQGLDIEKTTFPGAPDINMNVFDNTIAEATVASYRKLRQLGATVLSEACQNCELAKQCAGGFYINRWDAQSNFLNPSVYHYDLVALYTRLRGLMGLRAIERRITGSTEPFMPQLQSHRV